MYRVMLVEDEIIVRAWLKKCVSWEKYGLVVCCEAANGKEALKLYEKEKPDIILTDLRMPVMDGMELIRAIRACDRRIRFIVMTCLDEFALAKQAIELDVTSYILKLTSEPDEIERELQKAAEYLMRFDSSYTAADRYDTAALSVREQTESLGRTSAIPGDKQTKMFDGVSVIPGGKQTETSGRASVLSGGEQIEASVEATAMPREKESETFGKTATISVVPGSEQTEDLGKAVVVQNPRFTAAVRYLENHYADNISLQQVAEYVGVTPNYLGKLFLMYGEGHSFTDELNRLRICEAKRLLDNPACRVYEVAEKVGFANSPYFFRVFKKHEGCTPIEYRGRRDG